MKLITTIKLNSTKGKKFIKDATDVFQGYISSSFDGYTDKQKPTEAATLEINEMEKDATFQNLFKQPEKQIMTQEQIVDFCHNHKDKLRTDGYSTFFLFKKKEEFFVANVHFDGSGRLEVYVYEFSLDYIWDAGCQHRVVSPQLDSETLSEKSLEPLVSLTLDSAIKICKENGYKVIKEM